MEGEPPAALKAESAQSDKRPEPPAEKPTTIWTRRLIILAFWVVVAGLGLPHWVWTTSIHRSDLPIDSMNAWADGKTCQLRYPLLIQLNACPNDTCKLEPHKVEAIGNSTQAMLRDSAGFQLYDFNVIADNGRHNPVLTVNLDSSGDGPIEAKLKSWLPILDVKFTQAEDIETLATFISQEVRKVFEDERASLSYLLTDSPFATGNETLLDADEKLRMDARTTRAFKYASAYHLTFSLFVSSASPSAWEIEEALEQYLRPLSGRLSSVSKLTVETQVQLHASFSPSIAGPTFDPQDGKWKLQKTDLSGFVNAAEWPLNPSIGSGPTINFVLYVPSEGQSPLVIAETGGNSWVIPQWGGVQIFNRAPGQQSKLTAKDLEPVMLTFADQLTSLLGVPPSPPSLALRISSLRRERATSLILSASSTLGALSRLTHKLTSIAIPDSVAKSVDETIHRLESACEDLQQGDFASALMNARIANDEAEQAFFEPSMVGQVYFPDEHKIAVYVPLLGPMAVPLVMAGVKEIRKMVAARKIKAA